MDFENDQLDGCEIDFTDPDKVTADEDVAALVLFADVEFLDEAAVAARVAEYAELAEAGAL